ncbi:hypothetical protein D9V41_09180 [Aeromicrobium phragmitis]|uniref:Uncharacterized protein n=1 Tax=Aeromicrobium phragmitis TaxID=2478914 RepID=A0A3L8PLC0_9ACTN|nr:hypothetical protein [Aeromicrobium phragmitis]RLV56050.1 hypothetical protein D9V41_09180 [Aeromicrobium phragmitis]
MRVKVYLADGGTLEVNDFDEGSALDLRNAVECGESWLTFEMDDATVLVSARQVVRIDFDGEAA